MIGVAKLAPATPDYERLLLEVIGVFEAHETARPELLGKLLAAKDPRVRAYGARVAGAWAEQLPDALKLLHQRVQDENPRVRLEAVVAASYVPKAEAVQVVTAAVDRKRDPFLDYAIRQSARALQPRWASALAANQLNFGGSVAQAEYLTQTRRHTAHRAIARRIDLRDGLPAVSSAGRKRFARSLSAAGRQRMGARRYSPTHQDCAARFDGPGHCRRPGLRRPQRRADALARRSYRRTDRRRVDLRAKRIRRESFRRFSHRCAKKSAQPQPIAQRPGRPRS